MLTERTAATDEAVFKFNAAAASGLIFPSSIDVRRKDERSEQTKRSEKISKAMRAPIWTT